MWKALLLTFMPVFAIAHPKCPLLVGDHESMMPVYVPVFAPKGLVFDYTDEEWASLSSEEHAYILKNQFLALFRAGLIRTFRDLTTIAAEQLQENGIAMSEATVRLIRPRAQKLYPYKQYKFKGIERLALEGGLNPRLFRDR